MRRFIKKTKRNIRKIKFKPKTIALLSVFMVGFFAFALTVFADQDVSFELEPLDGTSFDRGAEFDVMVKFNTSHSWKNASMSIVYDTNYLELTEYNKVLKTYNGDTLDPPKKNLSVNELEDTGQIDIPVMNLKYADGIHFSGGMQVEKLTFTVKDDAPGGSTTIAFKKFDQEDQMTFLESEEGDYYENQTLQNATITINVARESSGITPTESEGLSLDVVDNPEGNITIWSIPEGANVPARNESFSSNKPNVATVDSNGVVTAVGPGTATITVSEYGNTHYVPVTVTSHLTSISLDASSVALNKTQEHTFTVTENPSNNSDEATYSWQSSNPSAVQIVSHSGKNCVVRAVGGGTSTITATASVGGGNITASSTVNVSVPLNSVSANPSTINLVRGSATQNSQQINVVYDPSDTTVNRTVSWTVNPTGIVTIDQETGTVTAVAKGQATVTGTVAGAAPFNVTVNVAVPISNFTVSPTSGSLYVGQQLEIEPTFTPAKDTISENTNITWGTSNSNVATVSDGTITAVGAGTATITATTGEGTNTFERSITITVYENVTGVNINSGDFTVYTNTGDPAHTKQLTATEDPPGSGTESDRVVTWSSNHPEFASVDSATGLVTAVANGEATITATLGSGAHTSITAYVRTKVETFTLTSSNEIDIIKGGSQKINTSITPSNASNKTITWETSPTGKVNVASDGTVTAVAAGTTVVTGTLEGKTVQVTVHVLVPATSVTINQGDSLNLSKNDTDTLTATIGPEDSTETTVTWASDDPTVVEIDENTGTYIAKKGGTAHITATVGEVSDSITMNVIVHATGFNITDSDFSLSKGNYRTLNYTVTPTDATDEIVWTSNPTGKVTIDENGKVTATATGQTTVTGTINGHSDSVVVNVTQAASGITINGDRTVTLELGDVHDFDVTLTPSDATDTPNWTFGTPGIASIDEDGHLTTLATGETTLTATVGSVSDTITLKVKLYATGVTITNGDSLDVFKNVDTTLTANVTPDGTTDTLSWGTSDSSKVSIVDNHDGTATIRGKVATTSPVTITATAGNHSDTIAINVKVATTGISITQGDSIQMNLGTDRTLSYNRTPSDATDSVTWSSDSPKVTVNPSTGKITAVETTTTGPAHITVTSGSYSDTIAVNVVLPAESVTIAGSDNRTIHRGGSEQLSATVTPTGTTDELEWISDDPTIASVDSDGNVTALKKGTTRITARAGSKSDYVNVTVDAPITDFDSDNKNISIVKKQTQNLQYTITPSDTTDSTTITWTSGNNNIVTVDSTGKITAKGQGNTTVTATLGSRSITYNIEVTIVPMTGLSLNKDELDILKGQTDTSVTYSVTPANTTEDTEVTWTSDHPEYATVDSDGHIKGIAAGEATITATMGSFSDSIHVTVTEVHLTGIEIAHTTDVVEIGGTYQVKVNLLPSNCTDDVEFTYESSNEEVATVDANGVVKGLKTGTVTIKAVSNIGNYEDEIELNIVVPVKPVVPNTGTKSAAGYIITAIISLLGTAIIAKKRFN